MLDCAGDSAARATEELELEFWKRLCSMEPLPGVREVLGELLCLGVRTGVVSNSFCASTVLRYELRRNGFLDAFEFVVSSADYGIQKPHPMIFNAALARLGCDPSEVWFVGDNFEKDIVGASAVGMPAIWLYRGDVLHDLPRGTIRISAWREFLALLRSGAPAEEWPEREDRSTTAAS